MKSGPRNRIQMLSSAAQRARGAILLVRTTSKRDGVMVARQVGELDRNGVDAPVRVSLSDRNAEPTQQNGQEALTTSTLQLLKGVLKFSTILKFSTKGALIATVAGLLVAGDPGENVQITAQSAGICERTAQVVDTILANLPLVDDCTLVTDDDLASLTGNFLYFGQRFPSYGVVILPV